MLILSSCHRCGCQWFRHRSNVIVATIIGTNTQTQSILDNRRHLSAAKPAKKIQTDDNHHRLESTTLPLFKSAYKLNPQPVTVPTIRRIDDTINAQKWTKAFTIDGHRPSVYFQLTKPRLTLLVTVTSLAGFMMAPTSVSIPVLWSCICGTAFMSASANTFNQWLESPYDAQMRRTQSRVLVVGKLSSMHAFTFGACIGIYGWMVLYAGCNPLTANLGLLNVLLYACVYTPLKRTSIGCTWAGAVVGAIPPLMGYSAAFGTIDSAALVLAAILYSWQFPHFNGLSWNLRGDYSRAGYRVMCVTDPMLCRATSLR